ncbi:rhomboid-related protein 2-like [Ornithodoros turicata]|uniref:rhomboid-related protein 2-like n=1 Tax=Ornithodoros turicata TaxID=34597 RepID=UPI0031397BEF
MEDLREYWFTVLEQLDIKENGSISSSELQRTLIDHSAAIPSHCRNQLLELAKRNTRSDITVQQLLTIILCRRPTTKAEKAAQKCFHVSAKIYVKESQQLWITRLALTDYPAVVFPLAFILIVAAAQIVSSVHHHLWCNSREDEPYAQDCFLESPISYNPLRMREMWRQFSYSLLHTDAVSLAFNVLVELVVCLPIGMVHSAWKVPVLYFVGVFYGALASSFLPSLRLAGAAGGCHAILWSHYGDVLFSFREFKYGVVFFLAIPLLTAADICWHIFCRMSWVGHASGIFVGITVGKYCFFNRKLRKWELVIGALSALAMFVLFVYCATYQLH